MEIDSGTIKALPEDYKNWSSTVICFQEKDDEIRVYVVNCDDGVMYYIVSYQRNKFLFRKIGYTAGDFKVYFLGNFILDEEGEKFPMHSLQVEVYDIPNRRWITDDFPKLNAPKPAPFVYFIDRQLYVLTSSVSCRPGETHFEMLDINNISQGWVFAPEPSFVWKNELACHHGNITDYSKKMLYVRLLDYTYCDCKSDIYAYSLHDKWWHKYGSDKLNYLTAHPGNLLKASWSNNSVIVENCMYSFRMFSYPDRLRAILLIRDLEHAIVVHNNAVEPDFVDDIHEDNDPPVEGILEVNISSIVAPDVLHDLYAVGSLVYLGKRNSNPRFSLVISYRCQSCHEENHVYACSFDLTLSSTNLNQATAVGLCCPPCQHINMGSGQFACHKLCEVRDD